MAKTVQMFVANDGTPFMYLEAAITHDAVEGILKAIPELALMRGKLHANMQAIAAATSSMVDLQRKNHPEPPALDHPEPPAEVKDWGELTGTCDCSALMNGASDHHASCPSYVPWRKRGDGHRIHVANNQMLVLGAPAKDWLRTHGFESVKDFNARATDADIDTWDIFYHPFSKGEEVVMKAIRENRDRITSIIARDLS